MLVLNPFFGANYENRLVFLPIHHHLDLISVLGTHQWVMEVLKRIETCYYSCHERKKCPIGLRRFPKSLGRGRRISFQYQEYLLMKKICLYIRGFQINAFVFQSGINFVN